MSKTTLQDILPVLNAVSTLQLSLPSFLDRTIESEEEYINHVGPTWSFCERIGRTPGHFINAMSLDGQMLRFSSPEWNQTSLDTRLFSDFRSIDQEEAESILAHFLGLENFPFYFHRHWAIFEEVDMLADTMKVLAEHPFSEMVLGAKDVTAEVKALLEKEESRLNALIGQTMEEHGTNRLFQVVGRPSLSAPIYLNKYKTLYHQLPDGQIFYAQYGQDGVTWNLVEATL